jgi:hypothetical protein
MNLNAAEAMHVSAAPAFPQSEWRSHFLDGSEIPPRSVGISPITRELTFTPVPGAYPLLSTLEALVR